jgi:predicted Rossmann-fold nucleotide-binding protein
VDLAEALLILPGGFGTLDELMEILTLVQTGKIRKQIPIIIYGTDYWNEVINFEAMVKWGTISEADLDLFRFTNTPQETVEFLKQKIRRSGDSAAAKKGV